jgi:hypothetical protein
MTFEAKRISSSDRLRPYYLTQQGLRHGRRKLSLQPDISQSESLSRVQTAGGNLHSFLLCFGRSPEKRVTLLDGAKAEKFNWAETACTAPLKITACRHPLPLVDTRGSARGCFHYYRRTGGA